MRGRPASEGVGAGVAAVWHSGVPYDFGEDWGEECGLGGVYGVEECVEGVLGEGGVSAGRGSPHY